MLSPADILRLRGARSYPRVVTGANPAAGTEITVTVPGGEIWELGTVLYTLVTDATAANRRSRLLLDDGSTTFANIPSPVQQTATQTVAYCWSDFGLDRGASDGVSIASLPSLRCLLLPGYRIRTSTANLQAGDDYGAPAVYAIVTIPGTEREYGDPHGFRAGRGAEAESILARVS